MHQDRPSPIGSGVFLDGWLLDWPLGEGRTGVVFRCHRAEDPEALGAIKAALEPAGRDAVRREALALERLAHPAFPALLGRGERAGHPWFAMELVEGRSLASMADRPLPPAGIAAVLAQLADAVAAMHGNGLVHGDLKPAHVLVDDEGRARILDLGAAVDVSGVHEGATAAYAPPEWHTGEVRDARAADIYALGVIGWEALCGRPAFHGPDPMPRVALDPGQDAPPALRAAILACTSPDATERPDAATLRDSLAGARRAAAVGLASGTWFDGPPAPAAPAGALPSAGDHVGRYQLRGLLGQGGMGVVHRAWDAELHREVALKLTLPGRTDAERARREARALAQIAHPGIVQVLDMGATPSGVWFAMELVDGPNLDSLIAEEGPLPPERAASWARDLALALAHAHARGVVHRDLKPTNVLLDGDNARLVDFGLAAVESASLGPLTAAGAVLGTPAFMAPEQARGDAITTAADVYGLGAVLYQMLTGRRPFEGAHPAQVVHQVLHTQPALVHQLRPEVPEALSWIVARAMARELEDRYPSAQALADDLDAWLAGEAISAGPEPWIRAAWRWVRRNRRGLAASAAVAIGLLALTGLAAFGWSAASEWRLQARETEAQAQLESLRAAAEPPAALDARYEAYLAVDAYRGTDARIEAWVDRGQLLADLDENASMSAYARAYEEAGSIAGRTHALLALSRSFAAQGRWDARNAVAAAIQRRIPDWQGDDELADTVDRARASARLPALPLAADRRPPLQDRLLRGTPLARDFVDDARPSSVATLDIDQDGRDEAIVLRDGALRRVELEGGQVVVTPLRGAEARRGAVGLLQVDGEIRVVAPGPGKPFGTRLYAMEGDGLVEAGGLESKTATLAAADLDHDGRDELYGGTLGALVVWRQDGLGGWTHGGPAYGESRSSQVSALVVRDLDGDRVPEVLSFHGAWSAFDARLGIPGGSAALTLTARHKIGQIRSAEPVTLGRDEETRQAVAVVKPQIYASRQAFPEGDPYGPPPGVYVYGWSGGPIEVLQYLPAPPSCVYGTVLDLDLDGLDDIMVSCADGALLWRQEANGRFGPADALLGVRPLRALDADGDGADDLLAWDDVSERYWLLGVGDTLLPAREDDEPAAAPPGDVTAALRPGWERAEDLASLEMKEESAEAFERLARVADRELAAEARLRAAELWSTVGTGEVRALGLYEAAAGSRRTRIRALDAWAEFARETGRPEIAVDVARTLLAEPGLPDDVRAAWVEALPDLEALSARPIVDFVDGSALEMEVLHPHAVRVQREGVVIDAGGPVSGIEALSAPITWTGDPLRIELDVELRRIEWAGALQVAVLDSEGQRIARFSIECRGGGAASYLLTIPPTESVDRVLQGHASDRVRIRAQLDVDEDGNPTRLWRQIGDRDPWIGRFESAQVPSRTARPGVGRVVVHVHASQRGGAVTTALLHRLSITGVSAAPAVSEPESRARWELAHFNPQAALNLMPAHADPMLRAVALEDLGRRGEAIDALRAARLDDDQLDAWAALRPNLVHAAEPDGWLPRLGRARGAAIWQHPRDPGTADLLLDHADLPLELPSDPDDADITLFLVLARGRVLREEGRLGEVQTHVRWALDQADALEGRTADAARTSALVTLALLAADRGDRGAAVDHVLEAIDSSPFPELTADFLDLTVELDDLEDHPAWDEVRRARRLE